MSGNDGKPINRMSAKDIEAEKMAQELMSMEMYEDGMEYDQMKQILQVINESRDMAGIEPEKRSSQEAAPYLSEITPEVSTVNNIARESTSEVTPIPKLRPKPSFSYRSQTERDSPAGLSCQSPLGITPSEEMSVSSPEMFSTSEEPDSKRPIEESESIFDALVKENELDKIETSESASQAPIKNAWYNASDNSQNSQNSQSTEISVNIESFKSRKNQKVEAWKLDPTKALIADNDIPLPEKTRPLLRERVPYSFCHHEKALAASEKVMAVLTYQLEEVADIWRRKHKPDASEFQWGSPIKVGSDNGSLDKKPVMKDPETPEKQQSFGRNQDVPSLWRGQDRQCKRKAVEHIKDLLHDQIDSGEDSDNIFEKSKKSKKNDEPWLPEVNSKTPNSMEKHLTRRDRIFNNLNSNKVEKPSLITDYDSDEFDNDTLSSLRAKNEKKNEFDNSAASPESFLPRRIVPPNPAKPKSIIRPRNNGEKIKRKSPVRRNIQAMSESTKDSGIITRTRAKAKNLLFKKEKNQSAALSDNEIADELEKIENAEDQEMIEIKPLPVTRLGSKLIQSQTKLLQTRKTEEQLEKAKAQEQIRLQEEEKIKKEELIAARRRKEEEERRYKESKEREVKLKEEKWKKIGAIREKDRRNGQLHEKKRMEEAAQNQMSMIVDNDADDDENLIITNTHIKHPRMEEQMQCPICHLEFSKEDIQNHAANCDQFHDIDEPGGSRQSASENDLYVDDDSDLLVCNICSQFSTTNGTTYEEHVHTCLQRKHGEGDSRTQLGTSTTVIEVPTSPVRCYVPISEQTESAINYKEQHPKQSVKPKVYGNRRLRR